MSVLLSSSAAYSARICVQSRDPAIAVCVTPPYLRVYLLCCVYMSNTRQDGW
jgi:hypothetical protein